MKADRITLPCPLKCPVPVKADMRLIASLKRPSEVSSSQTTQKAIPVGARVLPSLTTCL